MRKIIILAFLVFVLLVPWLAFAQEVDCPYGLVNDPAPGRCSRYVDLNSNNICDLSEPSLTKVALGDVIYSNETDVRSDSISEEELKDQTVAEMAGAYNIDKTDFALVLSKNLGINVSINDSLLKLHDNNGLCMGVAASLATGLQGSAQAIDGLGVDATTKILPRYKLLPITVTLVILYLFTYILVLQKKITLLTHRRIWNVLLLLAFLPTLILGLLLIIRINRGWALDLPFNMLYWHVEFGTTMAIISIFHIAWHWRYYICMFKKRNCKS